MQCSKCMYYSLHRHWSQALYVCFQEVPYYLDVKPWKLIPAYLRTSQIVFYQYLKCLYWKWFEMVQYPFSVFLAQNQTWYINQQGFFALPNQWRSLSLVTGPKKGTFNFNWIHVHCFRTPWSYLTVHTLVPSHLTIGWYGATPSCLMTMPRTLRLLLLRAKVSHCACPQNGFSHWHSKKV